MTQYKRLGIDTSKAVFTLHGIDQQDRPVLRINLRRAQMIPFFGKLPPTEIAMELWRRASLGPPRTDRARPRGASDPTPIRQTLRQTQQE